MVKRSTPYRLLIADDDRGFREVLKSVFGRYFDMFEADSGEEAVEIGNHEHIDIALLDMHMQLLTGLDTLRILKTINAVAPCILITADPTEELRKNATRANAYSVLEKPVSRLELVTTVSTALEEAYEDPDVSVALMS